MFLTFLLCRDWEFRAMKTQALAFSPSLGFKGKIFFYCFTVHRKLIRALDSSKVGAAGAPDWDSFHLQHFFAKTAFDTKTKFKKLPVSNMLPKCSNLRSID
jgi:hypothetical protein